MVIYTRRGALRIDMSGALDVTDHEGLLTIRMVDGVSYLLSGRERTQAIHFYGITKGFTWGA